MKLISFKLHPRMVLPPGMLLLSVEEILFKAKPKGLKATIANINMHNVNLE